MLGVGAALTCGAALVFRKKFSVRKFTSDCLKYKVTTFQYIGELCRYLISAPENPDDKLLSIRYVLYLNQICPF
jgi:acyl-CoA synthetase (AMP-forming)/AMP-acid ligase II